MLNNRSFSLKKLSSKSMQKLYIYIFAARDLDDALHIKYSKHENAKCLEVGVHIADVTHFLQSDTELDKLAQMRGTSVYLVHMVNKHNTRIISSA